jgi:hypothetical protein
MSWWVPNCHLATRLPWHTTTTRDSTTWPAVQAVVMSGLYFHYRV